MSNYKNPNTDVSADNLKLKPFMTFLSYVKPYTFKMILSILLIFIIVGIEILNPIMIMISIDDIIKNDDMTVGVYEDYADISGITYGNKFYSTVSHNYKAPDSHVRMVSINGTYYFVPEDLEIPENPIINESDGRIYLSINASHVLLNEADANFVNSIIAKNKKNLLHMLIIFAVLMVLLFVLGYLNTLIRNLVGQKIIYNMRKELFAHILSRDVSFFEINPIGRLVTRTTNDIKNIHFMYTSVLLNGLKDLVLIIAIIITMFLLNVNLALVTLCLFPLHILVLFFYRYLSLKYQRELKIKLAVINSKLSEFIAGMKLIQIFTAEREFFDDFKETNLDYKREQHKNVLLLSIVRPFFGLIMGLAPVIILYYSFAKILDNSLEIGLVIAFIKYSRDYYRPLNEFSGRFSIMQSAMASMERIMIILSTENKIINKQNAPRLKNMEDNILFKDVYFKYHKDDDSDYIVKDINIDIKKGNTIAIVGHTGSGKTTITSLINRFYDIVKGNIYIDGVDIRNYEISSLRQKISVVLQDVFLFSDTVFENIRLYDENISIEDVKNAAKLVNADKIIEKLDGSYNYVLKEDGKELSEGERQLISFARAIVTKPKLLILDEATSSIDSKTESLIQEAVDRMKEHSTLIVIAHRLSTIKSADNIIVMSEGKIVESGKHEDLVQQNGLYHKLYHFTE